MQQYAANESLSASRPKQLADMRRFEDQFERSRKFFFESLWCFVSIREPPLFGFRDFTSRPR
jgi:hypothetical protein